MSDSATTELSAESWRQLSAEAKLAAFRPLPPADDDEFFLHLSAREQAELVLSLPESERRLWVRLLAPDDAADLIQESPPEERQSLLRYLDGVAQREVSALLAYAEDDAGGLMSTRFAR